MIMEKIYVISSESYIEGKPFAELKYIKIIR